MNDNNTFNRNNDKNSVDPLDNIMDKTNEELDPRQTTFLKNENLDIKNSSMNIENQEKILIEMQNRKQNEINSIIVKEKLEKEELKKEKRKKARKKFLKSTAVASCFLFFGIGVGSGGVISKNVISKQEQSNFKFNIENVSNQNLNESLMLISNSASSIFKEVGDSVVNISTKSKSYGFFNQTLENVGSGSGIIYKVEDNKVYIITNNHVIENAQYVTISVTGEEQIEASLIGSDPSSDLAVLSVKKSDMNKIGIENINVAKFADSDRVEVGDFVFPIGNALGRGKTMTQGMISAQNKVINIDGKNLTVLQTDAAINPGNSGGALMNINGEVVGINTAKLSSSAIEGIGYAIPTNIALEVVDQIIENGFVQRPYLGISGRTITEKIKEIYGIKTNGVLVANVEKGSNADKAGILQTDIITNFNGIEIKSIEDLSEAIKKCKANDTVSIKIIRNGSDELTLSVKLAPSTTPF